MKIPLPNLDDRRWADLVDEGRSLIPLYAPDWTDHNIHDPGITLTELFAWLAEMDIYELDRITDQKKRKFLALLGIIPGAPRPAATILSFNLKHGAAAHTLVPRTELACKDAFGEETRFRLSEALTLTPGELAVIQIKDATGFHDLTASRQRRESIGLFGNEAQIGTELYLGFTERFNEHQPVSIHFVFAGGRAGADERHRLIEEREFERACCSQASECETCKRIGDRVTQPDQPLRSNRVRIAWEVYAEVKGRTDWVSLNARHQLEDDTRGFTLDGRMLLKVRPRMARSQLGQVAKSFFYVRGRLEAGAFDAPPVASSIIFNGAAAEQTVPVVGRWIIESGVIAQGKEPKPGETALFILKLNDRGHITSVRFDPANHHDPRFLVLEYEPPTAVASGLLSAEVVRLSYANGRPNQEVDLPLSPAEQSSCQLFTEVGGAWRAWTQVEDFFGSTRRDAHFVLDPSKGKVKFGDGEKGLVPPQDSGVFAAYRTTRAENGNLPAGQSFELVDSSINRILVEHPGKVKSDLQSVTNAVDSSDGTAAETLNHATGRSIELMNSDKAIERAVTLEDYERLAKQTPGARIARAGAWANLDSSFPCFLAPGMITLLIVPDQPIARPSPGAGLIRDVTAYLNTRRLIGTRVRVIGPHYLEITVQATARALPGVSIANLRDRINIALNEFFDPLHGGPDRTGWPFGRDVFRSEVMQVIDEVAGVDHVVRLDLIADGCGPLCGNVCLPPASLVASGDHQIDVV